MTAPIIFARVPFLPLTVLAASLALVACTATQQETDLSSTDGTKLAHRAPIIQKTSMPDQAPADGASAEAGVNQASVHRAEAARTAAPVQAAVPASTPASFRFSRAEMEDIANPDKLSWRIFYDKPSSGPDAAWFDAVKRGDFETVKKMLAAGQDIEAKDNASLGQTALGWAAFIGYEDIVDYLIAQGADLRATDRGDVYNVLKSAVLGKNVNIVKKVHALLKDSTDLNDQTVESDGETLVMVAASNNRLETVKYLISQGADLNLVSKQKNHSALSFACARHYPEMQQLLISHGAINHRTGKPGC